MDIKKRLQDLNELHEAGLITEAEYNQRREKLLIDLGGDTTSAPYSPSKHTLVELMEGMEIGPDNHRFRLKREIGGGAMGRVWQAHDLAREELDGGTHYKALKVVAPELLNAKRALENLKREAIRASELNHPNIININGWQQGRDNWLFIEMEYLVGKDLDDLLGEEGEHGLPLERVTSLLKQMAQALDYAHKEYNLIHRDLKPGNVYVTQASRIKLLDFGLAYQLRQSRSSIANAAKTDSSGTPIYMPPEAFVAGRPDPRQDVYALACLTYELLTGQPPYSEDAARNRPASLYPPQPEVLSKPTWEALKQGLAHDRGERPKSAGELYKCFIAAQHPKKRLEAPKRKEPAQETCANSRAQQLPEKQPEAVIKQRPATLQRETALPPQVSTIKDNSGWKTVVLVTVLFAVGFGYYQYDAQLAQEREQIQQEAKWVAEAEQKRLAAEAALQKKAKKERLAPRFSTAASGTLISLPDGGITITMTKKQAERLDASLGSKIGDFSTSEYLKQRGPFKMKKAFEPEMVDIPGGSFRMGCVSGKGCYGDEKPIQRVSLKPFQIGKYEVTQKQWLDVMGSKPSSFKDCGESCPVESVFWDDVQKYLKKLNSMTGKKYRLPTESEWEYAARAGTTGPYSFSGKISSDKANYDANYTFDGSGKGEYRGKTVAVGSFAANPWGLHDMHGNVYEWTADCWNKSYRGAPTDGSARQSGDCGRRVWRGASWESNPWKLRSAYRFGATTDFRGHNVGFRVAIASPRIK